MCEFSPFFHSDAGFQANTLRESWVQSEVTTSLHFSYDLISLPELSGSAFESPIADSGSFMNVNKRTIHT